MPIRMLKKDEDEKKQDKKKKPKGSSKLDIFKSYGKYDGKPVELKAGGLTGNQHKLDKNKDGKISGEDFKMMKRKRGGATRKHPNSPKGQNPISEYDKKGKLKYTAANQGAMMNKSTRGYGAARTSGMGLQDEQVKPGKVKPVKTGGPISGPKGRLPRMSDIDKNKIDNLKQQFNRFRNTSTKGGGADASKIMSDKTKQTIKKLVERIGRLTPAAKIGAKIGKKVKDKKMGGGMMKKYSVGGNVLHKLKSQKEIKKITDSDEYKKADYFGKTKMLGGKAYTAKEMEKKISKKMGGGMMMKPMGYKSGTSVMARGCKLGRNKTTKLY